MTEDFSFTDFLVGIVTILIVLFFVFGLPRIQKARVAKRVTIPDFQAGLLIRKGKVERQLGAGQYSTWMSTDTIELYDLREQSMQVAGQEVLTKDLLPVKLSLLIRYRISDPKIYRSTVHWPPTRLYEDVQLELRKRVAGLTLDEVMADREKIMAGFAASIAPLAKPTGLDVSAIELRDITPAGAAKQAFADIWKAQKDGQAALERARGEQASLRSLANAARMLKGNPELMNLRLLQALSGGPGKPAPTIVLGGGAGLLPVSADAAPEGEGS